MEKCTEEALHFMRVEKQVTCTLLNSTAGLLDSKQGAGSASLVL